MPIGPSALNDDGSMLGNLLAGLAPPQPIPNQIPSQLGPLGPAAMLPSARPSPNDLPGGNLATVPALGAPLQNAPTTPPSSTFRDKMKHALSNFMIGMGDSMQTEAGIVPLRLQQQQHIQRQQELIRQQHNDTIENALKIAQAQKALYDSTPGSTSTYPIGSLLNKLKPGTLTDEQAKQFDTMSADEANKFGFSKILENILGPKETKPKLTVDPKRGVVINEDAGTAAPIMQTIPLPPGQFGPPAPPTPLGPEPKPQTGIDEELALFQKDHPNATIADMWAYKANQAPDQTTVLQGQDENGKPQFYKVDKKTNAVTPLGLTPAPKQADIPATVKQNVSVADRALRQTAIVRDILDKNPQLVGPFMGRMSEFAQGVGSNPFAGDPKLERLGATLTGHLKYLFAQELKNAIGARPGEYLSRELKEASPQRKQDINILLGALDSVDNNARITAQSAAAQGYDPFKISSNPLYQSGANVPRGTSGAVGAGKNWSKGAWLRNNPGKNLNDAQAAASAAGYNVVP